MSKNKTLVFLSVITCILLMAATDGAGTFSQQKSHAERTIHNPDLICGDCHAEIVADYQLTDKSRSFSKPSPGVLIEHFDTLAYYHKPSRSYFHMEWDEELMWFTRYQINDDGERVNEIRRRVDWILGSGDDIRTYLYQTDNGELFQLPVAWHTDNASWGMAPGFTNTTVVSIEKSITGECLFCHNDFPGDSAKTFWNTTYFPNTLPGGIGCMRCHGNAADHVRLASSDLASDGEIRASIINPDSLAPNLRDDVCNQCHLQPTTRLDAERIFHRDVFSYMPGESLHDYRVEVDIANVQPDGERTFELNHHAYRLYQSQCYQVSENALACTSCHDIHDRVEEADKATYYATQCMQCHNRSTLPEIHGRQDQIDLIEDCISCHMPDRRTHDFIEVVTTDHLIRVVDTTERLTEVREEESILVRNVMSYNLPPLDTAKRVYLAVAVLKQFKRPHIVAYVKKMLAGRQDTLITPHLYLAEAEMSLNLLDSALVTLNEVLEKSPGNIEAKSWKGVVLMKLNRVEEAKPLLENTVRQFPRRAEGHFNLGLLYYLKGEYGAAQEALEQSLILKANFKNAWYYLARIHMDQKNYVQAEECAKRALAIDPVHERSYLVLRDALVAQNKKREAISYLEHAFEVVINDGLIARELNKMSDQ